MPQRQDFRKVAHGISLNYNDELSANVVKLFGQ